MKLADDLEMPIRVAHYPPGCSKYNPIEHRMFCHITQALRGVVLKTVDIAKQCIALTKTETGLRVLAEAARRVYHKGLQASAEFLENRPIQFPKLLPELNYIARPSET